MCMSSSISRDSYIGDAVGFAIDKIAEENGLGRDEVFNASFESVQSILHDFFERFLPDPIDTSR